MDPISAANHSLLQVPLRYTILHRQLNMHRPSTLLCTAISHLSNLLQRVWPTSLLKHTLDAAYHQCQSAQARCMGLIHQAQWQRLLKCTQLPMPACATCHTTSQQLPCPAGDSCRRATAQLCQLLSSRGEKKKCNTRQQPHTTLMQSSTHEIDSCKTSLAGLPQQLAAPKPCTNNSIIRRHMLQNNKS
jgi:hypothetical protein